MKPKDIVDKILNNRVNYKYEENDETRTWCDYKENNDTTIYLNSKQPKEPRFSKNKFKYDIYSEEGHLVELLIVAAHESCHALNYSEGKTDINKLQALTKKANFGFKILGISFALTLVLLIYKYWLLIVGILLIKILAYIYYIQTDRKYRPYYYNDEKITETRVRDELENHVFPHLQSNKELKNKLIERNVERLTYIIEPLQKNQVYPILILLDILFFACALLIKV